MGRKIRMAGGRDSSGACPLGEGAIGSDVEQVVFEGAEFIAQAGAGGAGFDGAIKFGLFVANCLHEDAGFGAAGIGRQ